MSFFPVSFKIGEVVDNNQITKEFKCGNMGGMRRSHKTNTLVIISDHTKGLYDDKWYEDILHYTGMGKIGDQNLNFMQNKTLNESRSNDIEVHLFEVFEQGKYLYRGLVELIIDPYQEDQKGDDGIIRKVWMFPLKLQKNSPIDKNTLERYIQSSRQKTQKLAIDELKQRALDGESKSGAVRIIQSKTYIRNEDIAEYTKRMAKGQCQLCEQPAPFADINGTPYLESHHVEWLSKGGADTIDNTVALCPNCHRKMHVRNNPEDIRKLKEKIKVRNKAQIKK